MVKDARRDRRREYGSERMMKFKSRVNELKLLTRLSRNNEVSQATLTREVERVQMDLYFMTKTPR